MSLSSTWPAAGFCGLLLGFGDLPQPRHMHVFQCKNTSFRILLVDFVNAIFLLECMRLPTEKLTIRGSLLFYNSE